MLISPLLVFTIFSFAHQHLAIQIPHNEKDPILYPEAKCEGTELVIPADGVCNPIDTSKYSINGAKVPEGSVCDFYSDGACNEPLWIGMEDPGECDFSVLEIGGKTGSVLCYRDVPDL